MLKLEDIRHTSTGGDGGSAITASTAAADGDGSGGVLEIEADSAVILSEHPNLTMNPKQSK